MAARPTTAERRDAALAALDARLEELVASGDYARWFAAMASFRRYSINNTWLILAQQPDATRVASFGTWKELGRHPVKGSRGIQIVHPKPFWVDPATGDKVRPPSNPAEAARLQRRVAFGHGYVYDISQTAGDPLPDLQQPPPEQAPAALTEHLTGYCRDHAVTVEDRPLRPGLRGYYQRDGDRIVLADDCTPGERAAVLAHELAHREDPALIAADAAGDRAFYAHTRPDCEAVAEAAAHVISARYGHDITGHSAGYIASWVDGDVDRLKTLGERVGQVVDRLVAPDVLDAHLTAAQSRAAAAPRRDRSRGGSRR